MVEVRCLLGLAEIILSCLGCLVLMAYVARVVNKIRWLQVFHFKSCVWVISMFRVPVYCRYFMEHGPSYPNSTVHGMVVAQSQ